MFDFSLFSRQVNDLRGQVDALAEKIEKKQAHLKFLRTAPPPKSDLKAAINVVLDARAASAKDLIENSLAQWQERPLALQDGDRIAKNVHILNAVVPGVAPTPFSLECSLLAVIGPQIKEGIGKLVDSLDWPQAGPPLKERQALIEAGEEEVAEMQEQLEVMRQQAAAAGLLV